MVLCLLLSAAPVTTGAATATVTAQAVTVDAGGSVYVNIDAVDFADLAGLELYIYYDAAALSVSSTSNGSLLSGAQTVVNTATAGQIKLSTMSLDGISGSGRLLRIRFQTASDCPAGEYPIRLAVGDAYDAMLSPLSVGSKNGSVTVKTPGQVEIFNIYTYASASTLQQEDVLTVRIANSGSRSFTGAEFTVEYDPEIFQYVSYSLEAALKTENAVWSVNAATLGKVRISYIGTEPVNAFYLVNVDLQVIADKDGYATVRSYAGNVYREDLTAYGPGSAASTVTLKKKPVVIDYPDAFLQTEALFVGQQAVSLFSVEGGTGLAAADFTVTYDPAVLQCVAVTKASPSGMVVINDNFTEGQIRFSYVNTEPCEGQTPLVQITWLPLQSPDSHYALTLSGKGVVDLDQGPITLEYVTDTGCIHAHEVTAPTCTADGYTTVICHGCGDSYRTDPVPRLGHDLQAIEAKAPTCTESGWSDGTGCTRCDYRLQGEVYPALGHDYVNHAGKAATCTEIGWYAYQTCNRCDYNSYAQIPELGHNYIDYPAREATCDEVGWEAYHACSRCDSSTYVEIPALGHSWSQDGTTPRVCATCGRTECDVYGHSYETVGTPPTCTASGALTHTCAVCGYTYAEDLGPKGHSFMDKTCVDCGEPEAPTRQWDLSVNGDGSVMASAYANMDGTYLLEIAGEGPVADHYTSPFTYELDGEIDDIRICEGVTALGNRLFSNVRILGQVQIASSVTEIGDYTFYGFSGPRTVTLPAGVTSIGNFAFYGSKNLTVILLGDSKPAQTGSIWDYNCGHYIQPKQVIETEDATYVIDRDGKAWLAKYCRDEESFVAETSVEGVPVTGIGAYAFDGKTELITYTVPAQIDQTGSSPFVNCSNLTVLFESNRYPSGFSGTGNSGPACYLAPQQVILMEDRLYVQGNDGQMYFARYLGSEDKVVVEATVEGLPVRHIGGYAFGQRYMQTVVLPDTIETIGAYAFIHSSVRQINLPDSLTWIKTWGFFGADLVSVTIPENVTSIEASTFSYCDYLQTAYVRSAYIAGQLTSSSSCGDLCKYAQTVVIPAGVENSWLPSAYAYQEEALVGDMDSVIYSNCAHAWQQEVILEAVPCQTDGLSVFTCSTCGVEKKEITPCHDEVPHEAQAVTCLEIGWDAYVTCTRCDYTTYAEIPALGHDPVDHEAQAVTCLEIGWDAYVTCTRCDYTTYAEIPALGHDIQTIEAKAPTCTEIGWSDGEGCTRCDYRLEGEVYQALGHDLVDHAAQAATCTEIGWYAYQTCSRGDYSSYEEIPALGHRIIEEQLTLVDPLTVSNTGENAFVLEGGTYYSNNHTANSSSEITVTALHDCVLTLNYGVSSEQNWDKLTLLLNGVQQAVISGEVTGQVMTLVLAAGDTVTVRYTKDSSVDKYEDRGWIALVYEHVWAWDCVDVPAEDAAPDCANGVVCAYCQETVKEALGHSWTEGDCTVDKVCTACGETQTATGHSWQAATCTQPETCLTCGATQGDALGHAWSDWQQTQAPTCTEDGENYRSCSACGAEETQVLPAAHRCENFLCTVCGYFDEPGLIKAMDLDADGRVTAFDAQLLAEANAGLRQLTDEQWTALGDLTRQDIMDYILGRFSIAK